jgi:hypothetical protein
MLVSVFIGIYAIGIVSMFVMLCENDNDYEPEFIVGASLSWVLVVTVYLVCRIYSLVKKLIPENKSKKLKRLEEHINVFEVYKPYNSDEIYSIGFNANKEHAYYCFNGVVAAIELEYVDLKEIAYVKEILIKRCESEVNNSNELKMNVINNMKL